MPTSTYQIVTQTVTVPVDVNTDVNTYTLTAPTGKKPISGGYRNHITPGQGFVKVVGSRPNGQDWVFEIIGDSFAQTVDLYLVTATL